MSKLVEKLKRLGRAGPTLGFRAAATAPDPGMVVIVRLAQPEKATALEGLADAFLLEKGAKPPEGGQAVWGVRLEAPSAEAAAQLQEKGCDFCIFDPQKAPASFLAGEGPARFVLLDPALPDSVLRSVEGLGVDGALIDMEVPALRVQHLLHCQRVAGLVRLPLLVLVSPELAGADLVQLRRAGVRGVVVKTEAREKLEEWRQALLAGPAPKERVGVMLPQPLTPAPPPPEPEEE